MSQEERDDKHLKHAVSRAQQPKKTPASKSKVLNVEYTESKTARETPDFNDKSVRWIYVGTSPVLSKMDIIQARKRFQTYMADN